MCKEIWEKLPAHLNIHLQWTIHSPSIIRQSNCKGNSYNKWTLWTLNIPPLLTTNLTCQSGNQSRKKNLPKVRTGSYHVRHTSLQAIQPVHQVSQDILYHVQVQLPTILTVSWYPLLSTRVMWILSTSATKTIARASLLPRSCAFKMSAVSFLSPFPSHPGLTSKDAIDK